MNEDRVLLWTCDSCKDVVLTKEWLNIDYECECGKTSCNLFTGNAIWKGPMPRQSVHIYERRDWLRG